MKKTISILASISILQVSFAQITTTKVAEEKPAEIQTYDSLHNFLGTDYFKYKGQELFLIPKNEKLREYGYEGFIIDMNKSTFDKSNTFKCCDGYNSKYTELAEKYFYVEDVLKDPKSSFSSDGYLKLKMKESGEQVYFKYSTRFEHSFPFLVVGYYEKQKTFFAGKEILIRPFPKLEGMNQKKTIDINSGEVVEIQKGKYYKCIDLTIDEKYFEPALLLQGDNGEKFLFPLNARNLNVQRILTKEEVEEYKKKFGLDNWNTILEGKIKVGFTEEMTRVSWGGPDKVNQASYGDQWVYGNQYLYFENGRLESFN